MYLMDLNNEELFEASLKDIDLNNSLLVFSTIKLGLQIISNYWEDDLKYNECLKKIVLLNSKFIYFKKFNSFDYKKDEYSYEQLAMFFFIFEKSYFNRTNIKGISHNYSLRVSQKNEEIIITLFDKKSNEKLGTQTFPFKDELFDNIKNCYNIVF